MNTKKILIRGAVTLVASFIVYGVCEKLNAPFSTFTYFIFGICVGIALVSNMARVMVKQLMELAAKKVDDSPVTELGTYNISSDGLRKFADVLEEKFGQGGDVKVKAFKTEYADGDTLGFIVPNKEEVDT